MALWAVVALLLLPTFVMAAEANEGLTNWALGASYRYSMEPENTYGDPGNKLTDGMYGPAVFSDEAWVGHLRNDFRVITVDLGQVRPVQEVRANFLQDWSVGVRYPQEVIAEVSPDGVIWDEVGVQTFAPHEMDLSAKFSEVTVFEGLNHEVRYVRITVLVDVWVFMDEIEVLGR